MDKIFYWDFNAFHLRDASGEWFKVWWGGVNWTTDHRGDPHSVFTAQLKHLDVTKHQTDEVKDFIKSWGYTER